MGSKKRRQGSGEERSEGAGSSEEAPHWLRLAGREPIAIGLAVIVAYRPWVDGITFPAFNLWHIGAILILTAFWGVRLLLRGERLRCAAPSGILLGFLLIGVFTGFGSIQADATYRALLLWLSYLCLFLLCVNTLRTRVAIGIVLGAFVVSSLCNALWAIVHVEYVLPSLRNAIEMDPRLIAQYFPTPVITPEIHNRLMSNRAFGTFLFSNALAAFLIMGIPYFVGEFRVAFGEWRLALRKRLGDSESKAISPERLNESAGVGVAGWVIAGLAAWYVYPLLYSAGHPATLTGPPITSLLVWIGLVPLGVGMFCLVVARWSGAPFLFLTLKTMTLPVALVVQFFALYSTYSRGAMLGLAIGSVLALGLYVFAGSGRAKRIQIARTGVAGLLLAAMLGALMLPASSAQEDPSVGSSTPVEKKAVGQKRTRDLKLYPEGNKVELGEMGDGATFLLRMRYWRVSWRIVKEYFWTGTGLGNYQVAYVNHQYLGDPDVKMAHNDYLQLFCETGIFGFLAFCGFWIYFVVWGAFRIVREQVVSERWVLCGLYGGIMAFLMHSLVDFNFINPSMAMIVFCLAGIFYARAQLADDSTEPDSSGRSYTQLIALPLLFVTVFAGYQVFRIGQLEWRLMEGDRGHRFSYLGNREALHARAAANTFFLQDMTNKQMFPNGQPYIQYSSAMLLIGNRDIIESFGHVRVAVPERQDIRPLNPGEVPPPNTFVFISEEHFRRAMKESALAMDKWLKRVGEIDGGYGQDGELAHFQSNNYSLLRSVVSDTQVQTRYASVGLDWAREAVRRSPNNATYRGALGQSLWAYARLTPAPRSIELYYEGLPEYQMATQLYSSSEVMWRRYSRVLDQLVKLNLNMKSTPEGKEVMNSLGLTGDSSAMKAGVVRTRERADKIRNAWIEWGRR